MTGPAGDTPGVESYPPPVFICGTARSGTTLLVRLLDSHPLLSVLPTETQLYPRLVSRVGSFVVRLGEFLEWPSLVRALAIDPVGRVAFRGPHALAGRLEAWACEFPHARPFSHALVAQVVAGVQSPAEYWRAFLDLFAHLTGRETPGARFWVEKTPLNERYAPISDIWFLRRCRYLHILRDPRDFVASSVQRRATPRSSPRPERPQMIVNCCYEWSRSVQWCRHNVRSYPNRYRVLRYEDLVAHTSEAMAGIARFLEIPMDEHLLVPTVLGEGVAPNSSYQGLERERGVVQSQSGRYRDVLGASEVALIEGLLGAQMAACGYSSHTPAGPRARRWELPPGARRPFKMRVKAFAIVRAQRTWRGEMLPFAADRPSSAV